VTKRIPCVPNQVSNKSNKSLKVPGSELGRTVALSIILALGIRTFIVEARWIPSESMVPTLKINDKLIVDKLSYRLLPQRGCCSFRPQTTSKERSYS